MLSLKMLACGAALMTAGIGWATRVTPAAAAEAPYDWDLDAQYPNEQAWTESLNEIRQRLAAFEPLRGTPIASAKQLADWLDEVRYLRGRAGHMARFAILHNQVDETSQLAKTRLDAATQLEAHVEAGVAWVDSSMLANGKGTIQSWLAHEPRLARHSDHLNRVLRLAGHLPTAGSEAPIAALQRSQRTPTDIFDALVQADLAWPKLKAADGSPLSVDPGGYASLSRDHDRALRAAAGKAFVARIGSLQEPLGLLLTRRLGANLDVAHALHYGKAIDMFFDAGDGLPEGSYRKIVDVARANRTTLDRYARLVARVNHLTAPIELYDLYVSAPRFERTFTLGETIDNIVAAWAPMGGEYQALMRARLAKPWMDWRPRPHKSGVGVYWGVGDSDPYTVLTFDGNIAGTKTLAQAAPSIMFLADTPPNKLRERREDDFPVYGNAIWFLGQMRYDERLLEKTSDKAERISILYDNCRRLWANYFPYAMFIELEDMIYASIENAHPLSGAQISRAHANLLRDYYGEGNSSIHIDDAFGQLALIDGNTYYGEVLAEWAFAMSAAAAIAERLQAGDAKTIAALKNPLGNPASFTSQDLLLDASVDVNSPAPYEALVRRLNRMIDAVEKELAR